MSFRGVARDNIMRPDSSLEKLATLKPAFDKTSGKGTLTAGNSTPLTDGASACLLSTDEWAAEHGHEVLCHLRDAQSAAVDFVHGEGLLMAPTVAVAEMLKRNGLDPAGFRFLRNPRSLRRAGAVHLAGVGERGLLQEPAGPGRATGPHRSGQDQLNGSSLATGHPFAATGARIVATAAKELKQRGGGRCLVSICTAGGMGVVAILERLRSRIRGQRALRHRRINRH